jgi:uncharacterized Zn ribbon protein
MARKSCPRCGSTKIVENESSFKCLNCKSEFRINFEGEIEDEDMLTIQEMKGILDELGLSEDKTRSARLKEILDDKNNSKKER